MSSFIHSAFEPYILLFNRFAGMEFQKIISGKNKTQILHNGFRMQINRGPLGPQNTTYFSCVERQCKATLATLGDLDGELTLKYHREDKHTHSPDVSKNIVSASLSEFRGKVKANPDCSAKALFEEITTNVLESVATPNKFDLAQKLPTYRTGKCMHKNEKERKEKRKTK